MDQLKLWKRETSYFSRRERIARRFKLSLSTSFKWEINVRLLFTTIFHYSNEKQLSIVTCLPFLGLMTLQSSSNFCPKSNQYHTIMKVICKFINNIISYLFSISKWNICYEGISSIDWRSLDIFKKIRYQTTSSNRLH